VDPLVARSIIMSLTISADGVVSEVESEVAGRFLDSVEGPERAAAAIRQAQPIIAEHGRENSIQMAVDALSDHHPNREERIQVAKECMQGAGADGLSAEEANALAALCERWGLSPSDLA
jgi:hypothetical protein